MKKVFFLILSLIACFSIYAQNGGEFYYYKGERCYLNTSNDSALVYFQQESASGERVVSIPVSDSEGSATIDLQFLPGGHYVVQLVSSNRVLDAKPLVVE